MDIRYGTGVTDNVNGDAEMGRSGDVAKISVSPRLRVSPSLLLGGFHDRLVLEQFEGFLELKILRCGLHLRCGCRCRRRS